MAVEKRMSGAYRKLNQELHETRPTYGASGHKWAAAVRQYADTMTVLDYGCGKGTLKQALALPIAEYDPAIPGKAQEPDPADFVVCTDVLEHVEPEHLDEVLEHIRSLMGICGLLVVATRPARKSLSDGRNAHLIIENLDWWHQRLRKFFLITEIADSTQPGEYAVWVEPGGDHD